MQAQPEQRHGSIGRTVRSLRANVGESAYQMTLAAGAIVPKPPRWRSGGLRAWFYHTGAGTGTVDARKVAEASWRTVLTVTLPAPTGLGETYVDGADVLVGDDVLIRVTGGLGARLEFRPSGRQ